MYLYLSYKSPEDKPCLCSGPFGMNKEEADHYRKALKLNPETKEAKERLEELLFRGKD